MWHVFSRSPGLAHCNGTSRHGPTGRRGAIHWGSQFASPLSGMSLTSCLSPCTPFGPTAVATVPARTSAPWSRACALWQPRWASLAWRISCKTRRFLLTPGMFRPPGIAGRPPRSPWRPWSQWSAASATRTAQPPRSLSWAVSWLVCGAAFALATPSAAIPVCSRWNAALSEDCAGVQRHPRPAKHGAAWPKDSRAGRKQVGRIRGSTHSRASSREHLRTLCQTTWSPKSCPR